MSTQLFQILPYLMIVTGAGIAGGVLASFWAPKVKARSAVQHFAAGFRKAVSNTALNVDFMVAEGDFVVARWTIRGDHKLTGKKLEFVGVNIFRLKDGKVVEIWNHRDDLGFNQQTTTK